MEGSGRTPDLCTPNLSLKTLQMPKNLVTILLNVVCIILALITTICAAVTLKGLNFPEFTEAQLELSTFRSVENTRIQSRVSCAFVIIVTVATLAIQALMILVTILNFGFVHQYSIVLLIIKVGGVLVCAAVFFSVSVALAVYIGEWVEFKDLIESLAPSLNRTGAGDILIDYFNLNEIIPSAAATCAFGFLSTFANIGLAGWLVLALFIFKKDNTTQKN